MAGIISAGTSFLPSLLSSSDPAQDQIRKRRVDEAFDAAMAGAHAVWQGVDYGPADACLQSMAEGGSVCGVAGSWATGYAKARWLEYKARKLAGQVGTNLIGLSPIGPTAVRTAIQIAPIALLAIGALLFLRRR